MLILTRARSFPWCESYLLVSLPHELPWWLHCECNTNYPEIPTPPTMMAKHPLCSQRTRFLLQLCQLGKSRGAGVLWCPRQERGVKCWPASSMEVFVNVFKFQSLCCFMQSSFYMLRPNPAFNQALPQSPWESQSLGLAKWGYESKACNLQASDMQRCHSASLTSPVYSGGCVRWGLALIWRGDAVQDSCCSSLVRSA